MADLPAADFARPATLLVGGDDSASFTERSLAAYLAVSDRTIKADAQRAIDEANGLSARPDTLGDYFASWTSATRDPSGPTPPTTTASVASPGSRCPCGGPSSFQARRLRARLPSGAFRLRRLRLEGARNVGLSDADDEQDGEAQIDGGNGDLGPRRHRVKLAAFL